MSSTLNVISEAGPPELSAAKPPFSESALLGGVLAITALTYAWALSFPFVYDDHPQIVENELVHFWRYVPGYFRGYVWQYLLPRVPPNYYRPLNFVWFRLNDALFGLHPAAWHATTLLLHLVATLLAYRVARRLTRSSTVAAATALLFGVHPMRHEVVAWISGTTELLWSVLFFAAFLAYLRWREDRRARWMALSGLCYAAGLLAKESTIVLPVVIFLHAWIYGSDEATGGPARVARRLAEATKVALLYAPLAAVYLTVRIHVLGAFSHPIEPFSSRTLLLTLPSVLWFYAHQWLLPLRMSEFYALDLRTKFDLIHVLLPLLAVAAVSIVVWLARKRLGRREVEFAAVWMIVPLLPALDVVVFPLGQTVHDRYFYLPSFGAALLVGLALDRLSGGAREFGLPRRWLLATAALGVLLVCGTGIATAAWASDYALFTNAARFAPNDPILREYYARELERLGWLAYQQNDFAAAENYLERSVKEDPEVAASHFELGLTEMRARRGEQAEEQFRAAAESDPNQATYRFFLGIALARRGECGDAHTQFAEAFALRPGFALARELMNDCAKAAQTDPPAVRRDSAPLAQASPDSAR